MWAPRLQPSQPCVNFNDALISEMNLSLNRRLLCCCCSYILSIFIIYFKKLFCVYWRGDIVLLFAFFLMKCFRRRCNRLQNNVPARVPQLVYQLPWCVIYCLCDGACNRFFAANPLHRVYSLAEWSFTICPTQYNNK